MFHEIVKVVKRLLMGKSACLPLEKTLGCAVVNVLATFPIMMKHPMK